MPGHKHAGALDPLSLAATASGVQGKVQVRKTISDTVAGRREIDIADDRANDWIEREGPDGETVRVI
jgi:hypothetical protein